MCKNNSWMRNIRFFRRKKSGAVRSPFVLEKMSYIFQGFFTYEKMHSICCGISLIISAKKCVDAAFTQFFEIIHAFFRNRAYFRENWLKCCLCNRRAKKTIAFIVFLGFLEKSELLLTVTAKLLQKYGLYRVSSYSARYCLHFGQSLFLDFLS